MRLGKERMSPTSHNANAIVSFALFAAATCSSFAASGFLFVA